jgi:hypothetical protein
MHIKKAHQLNGVFFSKKKGKEKKRKKGDKFKYDVHFK